MSDDGTEDDEKEGEKAKVDILNKSPQPPVEKLLVTASVSCNSQLLNSSSFLFAQFLPKISSKPAVGGDLDSDDRTSKQIRII